MAKYDTKTSKPEQRFQETPIIYWPDDSSNEQEHETLDAADPGYVRGRPREELARFVVGLEDAKRVQDAPCVEPQQECAEHLQPGIEATVGGRRGFEWLRRCFARWLCGRVVDVRLFFSCSFWRDGEVCFMRMVH